MTNTDILRRLRYTFNFNDAQMIELFAHGNLETTRGTISEWLKKLNQNVLLRYHLPQESNT